MIGLGLGMIFKAKATSGGSDIIAMIVAKYTKLPLGQLMIVVDSAIVVVGVLAFQDWKIPLYSLIVIFITGRVVDVVLQGISYDKTLFIVSEKPKELRDKIVNDLNRGGTFIQGKGMDVSSAGNKEVLSSSCFFMEKSEPAKNNKRRHYFNKGRFLFFKRIFFDQNRKR